MTKDHFHIIKLGGTIEFFDPAYDAINKKLLKLDSTIDSYLHNLVKPHFNFSTESVSEKDSRDITEEDRNKLLKAVQTASHDNIIITHGTFTMRETAEFLAGKIPAGKRIVLTGSMIPPYGL